MTSNEILIEYAKCLREPEYFGMKYCEVFDKTRDGIFKLELFPKQVELLKHYRRHKKSIVLKPRQAGISTTTAFHCAHMIMFAPKKSPERVLIIANKAETANEFLTKIKSFIDSAPEWLLKRNKDNEVEYAKKNEGEIILPNGSGAKAKATSKDALRGYTPTLLIIDEAAFIENGKELWTAAAASLSTGGSAILISTPNGFDQLYYAVYSQAIIGKNNFKIFQLNWYEDPRFNKDLIWKKVIKDGDNIKEETVISSKDAFGDAWDVSEFPILIEQGYKPTSTWFEDMCKELNNDPRQISAELECNFLGSGDSVFAEDDILDQEKSNVKLPIRTTGFDRNIWIWEDPIPGHQYLMGLDVSRGDSADFSTMVVFDVDTGHQVMEWQGKVPPDILGVMANDWGLIYDALLIVDVTGGMGQATILKLLELKYPNLHYSSAKDNKIIKERLRKFAKQNDLVPGFIIGSNRGLAIAALEIMIREKGIAIRSKRFINECKTFVYRNGRPDHMLGHHDDLIMTAAIMFFVLQHSFKNLKRYKEQTIAMLNSWNVETNEKPSAHNGETNADIVKEFAWLFK